MQPDTGHKIINSSPKYSSPKYYDCGYECIWLTEVLFSSNAGDTIQGFMRGRQAITEIHPQAFVSTRKG